MSAKERIERYHHAAESAQLRGNPLMGLYIIESANVPRGSWGFAVGTTPYIHPHDLALLRARLEAGEEGRRIVRRGLSDVTAWLMKCAVRP